jgi:hypothetical protein
VDVAKWQRSNALRKFKNRLRHPPPLYKKVGGINAVVTRADGTKENLGQVSNTYARRWGVGTGR